MKIQEIIDKICQWHEPFENPKMGTRDLVLGGNTDQECSGIAITCCATFEVLEKAKEKNINFIITHESIHFGLQKTDEDIIGNDVYDAKVKYIEDNGLVVWRDHDRIHGNGLPFHPIRHNPDYIFYGLSKELGWDEYIIGDTMKPLWFKIPTTTAKEFAQFLIDKFKLDGLRIVGNMDCEISTVWFAEHVNGGKMDSKKIKAGLKADAIIPFEICDYTLTQYVKDAAYLGQSKVLFEMGHFNAEELGMKYMCKWLPEIIGNEIPIEFIQSGDVFKYIEVK